MATSLSRARGNNLDLARGFSPEEADGISQSQA